MKKNLLKSFSVLAIAVSMSSCYSLSYTVGSGSQTGQEVTGKNHYVIAGLVPVGKQVTPEELAGGAANYDVKIVHSFIDGILSVITGEIYTPTTVIVTK